MTIRAGVPVDGAARERAARDLDHSFVVEAGAGTGKTSLLVERFLAIVESGRAAATEIVAITFTEKAAGEMKLRIRREIEQRLEAGGADEAARRRLAEARDELERSPISTIHSFAASILREYPVEALVDPMYTQLDALEGSLFFDECWSDYLLERAEEREEAIRRFIMFGGSVRQLLDMARSVYDRRAERLCEGIFGGARAGARERRSGQGPLGGAGTGGIEALRDEFYRRLGAAPCRIARCASTSSSTRKPGRPYPASMCS